MRIDIPIQLLVPHKLPDTLPSYICINSSFTNIFFDSVFIDSVEVLCAVDEYGGHQVTKAFKHITVNTNTNI